MSSLSIQVKIIAEKFSIHENRTTDKTVIVSKQDGKGRLSTRKYGVIEKEEVFKAIDRGEDINLDHCYLMNFSLTDYRSSRKIKENELIKLKNFSAKHAFFDGDYKTDFSYCHFLGKETGFAYSIFNQGKVDFGHASAEENLNFNHVEFYIEELSFRFSSFPKGNSRFSSCIFDCKDVLFVNTYFGEGSVNFRACDFKASNCNFQYAQFKSVNLSFDKAVFNGGLLDFRKIEFEHGKADFRRIDFGDGNFSMDDAEFNQSKLNFKNAYFGNGQKSFKNAIFKQTEVLFDGSIFMTGLLSFKGSIFETLHLVDVQFNGHLDLRVRRVEYIDLSASIIRDILDLQADENQVKIDTLKIEGIKNLGKIFINWKQNRVYQLITSQADSSLESKALQFNLLKEVFHSNGQYDSEDQAYVAFKRFEMKANLEKGKGKKGLTPLTSLLKYGFQWLIFDKAGKFATDPFRVLLSMVTVLCFFAFLYFFVPTISDGDIVSSTNGPDQLSNIAKSFYHSAITFFTIGYGDHYPVGHIRWLSAVEGWAGVFFMSYFTVAFVRKILR